MNKERAPLEEGDRQKGSLLGPNYSDERIRSFLDASGAVYRYFDEEPELAAEIARLIDSEQVVGHMEGRMEFGPRALGNRSIMGDARSEKMQSVMNLKIKFRESFRPFAPSILRESVEEYFDVRPKEDSPYMLIVAPVRQDKRLNVRENGSEGLDKLKQQRSRRSRHYARRLFGSSTNGRCRPAPQIPSDPEQSERSGRLPDRHQHELQRTRRAHRLHTGRCLSLLHGDKHGLLS